MNSKIETKSTTTIIYRNIIPNEFSNMQKNISKLKKRNDKLQFKSMMKASRAKKSEHQLKDARNGNLIYLN